MKNQAIGSAWQQKRFLLPNFLCFRHDGRQYSVRCSAGLFLFQGFLLRNVLCHFINSCYYLILDFNIGSVDPIRNSFQNVFDPLNIAQDTSADLHPIGQLAVQGQSKLFL